MQKKLIMFIIALFFLSSAYLLAIGSKFDNLNFGSNWWTVYFVSPKNNDWDFVIENHGEKDTFHWQIFDGKTKVYESDSVIDKNDKRALNINATIGKIENKKITIEVSTGDNDKKDIYKNF